MRGAVRRSGTAGLITAVLTAGLTGCTGAGAEARACTKGTYAWSDVRRTQKLTALADPIMFEKPTDFYSAHLKPVDTTVYRPSVTGTPRGAGPADVIKALGRHLKTENPLAGPSDTEDPKDAYHEAGTGDLKGAYYSWASINLVDADFTYTCGDDEPARGHVRTWEGTGTGFLPCTSPPEGQAARTAAERSCGES